MLSSSGACVSGEWRAAPALNNGVGEFVTAPTYDEVNEVGDTGVAVVAATTVEDDRR